MITTKISHWTHCLRPPNISFTPIFLEPAMHPTTRALIRHCSALFVGIIAVGIAFVSLTGMHETFGKDLDYVEEY